MTFDNTNRNKPQKQAMTKDSIMALFNQGPTTGSGGAFQQQPPLIQGGFIPHGGMQMPAGFGLGGPPQQQPAPVSNMAAFNNPFLAMTPLPQVAPSASDPNNVNTVFLFLNPRPQKIDFKFNSKYDFSFEKIQIQFFLSSKIF
jgi:hypothetical protein